MQADVGTVWFFRRPTVGERRRGGEFLKTVNGFVSHEKVLVQIHGLHYVGGNDRCNDHVKHQVGNHYRRTHAVCGQYDGHGNENEGEGVDGNGVGRHGCSPLEGVANNEVAVADDAVVKALEREHRLLEHLHYRNTAHVFYGFGAHLFLCVEVHSLKAVLARTHHIAHDAEGADERYHRGEPQLPVDGKQKNDDAYGRHEASGHVGQQVGHEGMRLSRVLVNDFPHASRVLRVEESQRNAHEPLHGAPAHIGFDAEGGEVGEHECGKIE